jgi:hypothetical protein
MKKIFILLLIIVVFTGCTYENKKIDETPAIKNTIMQYNTFLIEGYKNMNMTSLKQVATKEHAMKVYHHMSALGEAGIRMEAEQKDITFLDIHFPTPYTAEVRTTEYWDYIHLNIDTNKKISENRIKYTLKYALIKMHNRWFVSDIIVEKEEKQQ